MGTAKKSKAKKTAKKTDAEKESARAGVRRALDKGKAAKGDKGAWARLRAGEQVSGEELLADKGESKPSRRSAKTADVSPAIQTPAPRDVSRIPNETPIFLRWPPGDPKRALLVRYNGGGNPVCKVAAVDAHGAYTGRWGSERTFAPDDVLGPIVPLAKPALSSTPDRPPVPIPAVPPGAASVVNVPAFDPSRFTVENQATSQSDIDALAAMGRLASGETQSRRDARVQAQDVARNANAVIAPRRKRTKAEALANASQPPGFDGPIAGKVDGVVTKYPAADKFIDNTPVNHSVEKSKAALDAVVNAADAVIAKSTRKTVEAKCPRDGAFLILTASGTQRVCSSNGCDYFERMINGEFSSYPEPVVAASSKTPVPTPATYSDPAPMSGRAAVVQDDPCCPDHKLLLIPTKTGERLCPKDGCEYVVDAPKSIGEDFLSPLGDDSFDDGKMPWEE